VSTHDARGETPRLSPEIVVYATNKNFLNVYDALSIDRVKLELAAYDKETHHQSDRASAYLKVDSFRLLAHLVLTRQFATVLPGARWENFSGGGGARGVESRVVTLEHDPGEGQRFAAYPYRLTITVGPGEKTATGAITPVKGAAATHKVAMRLPEAALMQILLTVSAYVTAWDSTHHSDQVAAQVAKQTARRARRDVDPATGEIQETAPAPLPIRPAAGAAPAPREINPNPCTPEQITDITKGFDTLRFDDATRRAWLQRYRVTSVKQLSVADATALHAALQNEYKARRAQTSRVGT
jgi:hypothetical protein